ncbi:hypothetical protein VitviT2T_026090 [Vitis vinifera]|uniref:Polygalacturonase n=1 Tax=Vitis vinifera TaxID=29760 RepID=A0ABY9DMQ2_VITVI|nr:hypothetical protein VitviT2T_026090 [Vitis vinifera]
MASRLEILFLVSLFSVLLTPLHCSVFDVTQYGAIGNGSTDDSPAFMLAWTDVCNSSASTPIFHIPGNKTFLLNPVFFQGPCRSTNIQFQIDGIITAESEPSNWKCTRNRCDKWIHFKRVDGLFINGSGIIDGNGKNWWSSGYINALEVTSSNKVQLTGLSFRNNPHMHVVFDSCDMVHISNVSIDAPGDSPNTDGIHLKESTHVNIEFCSIRTGDDCISIVDKCSNITIQNIECGPGHGISIGSMGQYGAYETVENIYVSDVQFKGSLSGVRIKTWQADAVEISDISYIDIKGTSMRKTAVKLACSESVPCKNIFMQDINLSYQGTNASAYYLDSRKAKKQVNFVFSLSFRMWVSSILLEFIFNLL